MNRHRSLAFLPIHRIVAFAFAPIFLAALAVAADTADSTTAGSPGGVSVGGGLLARKHNPITQGTPVMPADPQGPIGPVTGGDPPGGTRPTSRPAHDPATQNPTETGIHS
jgi:hypothetical protein